MLSLCILTSFLLQTVFALEAGHVFGLRTVAKGNDEIDGKPLYVYGDSTLGLHDPFNDVPQFQGVIMPEYGIVFQPEPCQVLKFSDRNIFTVNDSMYNPAVGLYEDNNLLKSNDQNARFVICPTWNHVLLIDDGKIPVCSDAVEVDLECVTEN